MECAGIISSVQKINIYHLCLRSKKESQKVSHSDPRLLCGILSELILDYHKIERSLPQLLHGNFPEKYFATWRGAVMGSDGDLSIIILNYFQRRNKAETMVGWEGVISDIHHLPASRPASLSHHTTSSHCFPLTSLAASVSSPRPGQGRAGRLQ